MLTATTSFLPEMFELGREDNQKAIVVVEQEIGEIDVTNDDQLISNVGDQFETDDYEGFLELEFMA